MAITATFRRHSRVLILVFMSVLMVVFVIGDALGRGCARAELTNQVIGTAFGESIREADVRRTDVLAAVARELGIQSPEPVAGRALEVPEKNLGRHLLVMEAQHLGVGMSDARIADLLREIGVTDAVIEAVRQRNNGLSLASIYDALRNAFGTQTMLYLQAEALGGETLPFLQKAYRDNQQEAVVKVSVIDAKALRDDVATPTDEELQVLFDAGKERDTAHTDEALVYGYRQPDRIRVEYLTLDPDLIREQVLVKEREVRAYFEQNEQRYWKAPAGDGAETTPIPVTFDEVREEVRADYRAVKAVEEAQAFINRLRDEAARPWRAAIDAGGQPTSVPADQIVGFEALVAAHASEYSLSVQSTDWLTREAARRLEGIGRARASIGRRQFDFASLAFSVEGLASAADNPLNVLRVGEPGPVVVSQKPDASGSAKPHAAWLFRVTGVAPAGAPADLNAVREQVMSDALDEKAYARAGELAQELGEQARVNGLDAAVATADELRTALAPDPAASQPDDSAVTRLGPIQPARFARRAAAVDQVGFVPALHTKVFELLDSGADLSTPQVLVVPDPARLQWIVVQVLEAKPLYEGPFQDQVRTLAPQLRSMQAQQAIAALLDYDAICKRAGFVDQRPPPPVEPGPAAPQ